MANAKKTVSSPAVETIPGLGPIRARALRKAGYEDTASLRRATLEDLTAVPGISEIKARQIAEYLQSTAPAPARARASDRRNGARPARGNEAPAPVPAEPPAATSDSEAAWKSAARRVVTAAEALLHAPHADDLDRPFARQVGKVAALAERLSGEGIARHGDADRTAAQLRRVGDLIAEAAFSPPGGKRQEKLAVELRSRRHKIQAEMDDGRKSRRA